MNWAKIKHFKREEFDSPDIIGSGEVMNQSLVEMLDELRDKINLPIKITSGFRSVQHNEKIGGMPNSAHLRGKAVDIAVISSNYRFKLLKAAFSMGFLRIEDAPRHIHLDIDGTLPQEVFVHLAKY